MEQKLNEAEQHLRQINGRLDRISDQIDENEYDLRQQNEKRDKLTRDADQRQATKKDLEKNIEAVNNQWRSKQRGAERAKNDVRQLEDKVQQIRTESRQAAERRQNRQYNHDELNRHQPRRHNATNQRT